MKDELAVKIPSWTCFADVQRSIDDWMDYITTTDTSGIWQSSRRTSITAT